MLGQQHNDIFSSISGGGGKQTSLSPFVIENTASDDEGTEDEIPPRYGNIR